MTEHFRSELKTIAIGLTLRVMEKLDDTPEAEALFLEWSNKLTALEPCEEEWSKLTPHIQWPI